MTGKGHKETLGGDTNILYLSYGVFLCACMFVKTHQDEHLKWVQFNLLYTNYTLTKSVFIKNFKIASLYSISPLSYSSISLAKLFERIVHNFLSFLFSCSLKCLLKSGCQLTQSNKITLTKGKVTNNFSFHKTVFHMSHHLHT